MWSWQFRKMFNALENRVKEDGKLSSDWFLGYMEGRGTKKLTGAQVGALVDLCLMPNKKVPFDSSVPADEVLNMLSVVEEKDLPEMDFLKNLS